MVKKWSEVIQDPQYQSLDPQKKETARNQYFQQVVAPQVPPEKVDIAKQQFDASTGQAKKGDLSQEVNKTGDVIGQGISQLRGRESGVDYSAGAPFSVRTEFYTADNDAERRKVLEKSYSKEGIYKDGGGNWIVTEGGKAFSVEGSHPFSNFGAQMVAEKEPIMGAMAGATAGGQYGAELGLAGGPFAEVTVPLGAMAGAGIGAMVGKGGQGVSKGIKGTFNQTPNEFLGSMAESGTANAAFELGGPLLGAFKRGGGTLLRKGAEKVLGVTPEIKELAKSTRALGGSAPISSLLPEAKTAQFKQELSGKTVGYFKGKENLQAMGKAVTNFLQDQGIPNASSVASKIILKDVAEEGRTVGEAATKAVQSYHQELQTAAKKEMQNANSILDDNLKTIQKSFGRPSEKELGMSQAEAVSAARSQFGAAASKLYKGVDRIAGNRELVPTGGITTATKKLIRAMPKTEDGQPIFTDPKLLKIIGDLGKLGEKIRFSDAQNIRSALGDLANNKDLTPGLPKRQFNQLRESISKAIDASAQDPAAAPAVKLLKDADKFYSDGIKKFQLQAANGLVRQAESKTIPDAKKVAEMIIRPGYRSQAQQFKNIVGEKNWRRVAEQDLKNIISASTDMEGNISSKQFVRMIKERGTMMDTIYGKERASEIKQYAQRLAMRDGKLPTKGVTPDNFVKALQGAEKASKDLAEIKETNFLSKLSKPGLERDQAFDFLVTPNKTARLEDAMKFFSNNPDIQKGIQQTFLKKALSEGFEAGETLEKQAINGNNIIAYINQFSSSQRKILLPGDSEKGLRYLAKEINFMFPSQGSHDMAAGLAAGSLKKKGLLQNFGATYGYEALVGWILSHPSVIDIIAENKGEDVLGSRGKAILQKSFDTYMKAEANTFDNDAGPKEPPRSPPMKVNKSNEDNQPSYGGPQ